MAQYSIKELESLSGIKAHTIRIWEQRYNLLSPQRTDTNIRYYMDEDLKRLLNVSLLNKNGFKISHIAEMKDAEIHDTALGIVNNGSEPDLMLESLIHAMLDFDENRFEKTLNSAILSLGFERAFVDLLLVFMQRVGTLWTTGVIRPAQEHFISNLIRRKLCVAIDNQYYDESKSSKKFVLFLPEGETHELLLLFAEYLLRSKNHRVAYLGCSLPFEDVSFINDKFKPDALMCIMTIPVRDFSVQEYIDKLATSFKKIPLYLAGHQICLLQPKLAKNCYHLKNLEDLYNLV